MLNHSETITKLVAALVSAEKHMSAPAKGATGQVGTRNYKYATLHDVRESYREQYSANGLVVLHSMTPQDSYIVLTTTIAHVSGEWASSDFPIPLLTKPQDLGSFLTYAKRYNVCAIADIVAEDDDDGKAAQEAPAPAKKAAPKNGGDTITREQALSVTAKAKEAGIKTAQEFAPILREIVGVETTTAIPQSQLAYVLEHLTQMAEHREPAA